MATKYLDFSPPVATVLNYNSPIAVIETGIFTRMSYPSNKAALDEMAQQFWQRGCMPCFVAVINGRLKAGLGKSEIDLLCQSGRTCSRWELPSLVSGGGTAGASASAAMAIARLADIVPVVAPGLTDSLADLDALGTTSRLVFCGKVSPEKVLLFNSRGVPVLRQEPEQIPDAYLVQRELELSECAVVPCEESLAQLADVTASVALALKKRASFQ